MQRSRVEVADTSAAGWHVAGMATLGVAFLLAGILFADQPPLRVIWPVMGLFWIAIAYGQWRNRVSYDADGLIVGGRWLARRVLAWPDLDRFEVRNDRRELGAWSTSGQWIHLRTYAKNRVDIAHGVAARLQRARPDAGTT